MASCYNCKKEFSLKLEVHRSTECSSCGRDVRVCRNCRFFSPGSHWDCRETVSESVREKEKANFCGFFSLKTGDSDEADGNSAGDEALSNFNNLFGDD